MEESKRKALEMLANGIPRKEICQELGIHKRTLERWLAALNQAKLQQAREQITDALPLVAAAMIEIATNKDECRKDSDRVKAAALLFEYGGMNKPEEKGLPDITLPDHPYSPSEALENWRLMQSRLQAMLAAAYAEGASSGNLKQMAEKVEALYRIAAIAKDFTKLQMPERLFDLEGDRNNSDDVIDLLLEASDNNE